LTQTMLLHSGTGLAAAIVVRNIFLDENDQHILCLLLRIITVVQLCSLQCRWGSAIVSSVWLSDCSKV
jgi:hypothetical protein